MRYTVPVMIRTDDLQRDGLVLLQDTEEACFSEDAVLLSDYLRLRPDDRVVDLGSGNGVISILGMAKTGASFVGVEKQESQCTLARQSAALNGQQIPFYCMDVLDAPVKLGRGAFTAAVMNPPYFPAQPGGLNPSRQLSRQGEIGALEDFLYAAYQLLKNGGKLFLCYPAEQTVTLFTALRAARLEPKRMRPALPDRKGQPQRILLEAKKGGKPGLSWEC